MRVSKYLKTDLVLFLDARTQEEVFTALVDKLDKAGKLKDKATFYQAVLDREKIVSTGIGMGVAIPHAKLDDYDDFFIAVAILSKGIDWHALDGSLVRLVFMIGGPDDKQTEYLQILSGLTNAVKDEERRKKMLTLNSATAIIELFGSF